MDKKYEAILNLPHHVSENRPKMSLHDRAAQFAPFAALTGFDDEIDESKRTTDAKTELEDDVKREINGKISFLIDNKSEMPVAVFTYFIRDEIKSGGKYVSKSGTVKKIDGYTNTVILTDGTLIPIDDIYSVDSEIFADRYM